MGIKRAIVRWSNRLVRVIPGAILAAMAVVLVATVWGMPRVLAAAAAVLIVPLFLLWLLSLLLADRSARLSRPSLIFIWLLVLLAGGRAFQWHYRRELLPIPVPWAAAGLMLGVLLVGVGLCVARSRLLDGNGSSTG